ncbi:myelin-associated glycoprotein-like [Halichoeres trimaculatus]|uniref:myelin-associated glycoprotein-like n=1 Tax=Halichoeres trimaculatus TaxID=147232 RepID=UPI003D9EC589
MKSAHDQLLLTVQQVHLVSKALLSPDMGVGLLVILFVSLMQGVSCKTWEVNLPSRLEGITESCITVPCGFMVPESYEPEVLNCSNGVVWRRGSKYGPQVFPNKIQGYIAGDVTQKNCTTVFQLMPKNYSDVYFLRLECPNTVKYTYDKGVIINTRPVPSPPIMTPVGQVSEGHLVSLSCSAPVFCSALPPSLTWLPADITWQETTQLQQVSDGLVVMASTVTFFASALHHNRSVACCVSYPLTKGGSTNSSATTQRLNVLYAPRSTTAALSPSGPVSEGDTVSFFCSSDANPPVSLYTWYRLDEGQVIWF